MKPRYNLRAPPTKNPVRTLHKATRSILSSRITKKAAVARSSRRHSLRLTPVVKQTKPPSLVHETSAPSISDDDDDDDLLARHHRRMLEEQKDRKLYERYVRDQRTLRRLQCRRTHTAHLNESTRTRLLRELERERRFTVHDQICSCLANHTLLFSHGKHIDSDESIDWSSLEKELPQVKAHETVRQLDVMINNLKRVMRNAQSSTSKPRLSVHERQKQRFATATDTPVASTNPTAPSSNGIESMFAAHGAPTSKKQTKDHIHPFYRTDTAFQPAIVPRLSLVRFLDEQAGRLRMDNSQHLTCIQNVLLQNNNNHHHHCRISTNDIPTPIGIRKQFLRSKFAHVNHADSSQTKKRPLEKENCSLATSLVNSHSNVALPSSSSHRPYPNTRKHPMNFSSSTTRRQKRLS